MGKSSRVRRILVPLLLILVFGVLVYMIFSGENISGMINALSKADYRLVILALCVYFFGVFCWSARWRYTLSSLGHRLPLSHVFQVVLSGIFVNNITPMTYAGGDPIARTILLSRTSKVPASHASATIVSELLLDIPLFSFLLLFGILTSFILTSAEILFLLAVSWVLVIFLFVFGISAFLRRRIGSRRFVGIYVRILRIFHRKADRRKISVSVNNFYSGANLVFGRLRVVAAVTLISSFLWAVSIFRLWTVFSALGYSPQLPMLMLALTLPAIAGLIPLLPGGIGTVDLTILSVFLMFKVPEGLALSALLIDRSITLLFGTCAGALAISRMGFKAWRGDRLS
ncbi:MAG: lysylphosphatidylglycerol synthase transmembrane domain-containing protein [Candidatus Hadarchaeales archaeon]